MLYLGSAPVAREEVTVLPAPTVSYPQRRHSAPLTEVAPTTIMTNDCVTGSAREDCHASPDAVGCAGSGAGLGDRLLDARGEDADPGRFDLAAPGGRDPRPAR